MSLGVREGKSIGVSAALILLNIGLMAFLADVEILTNAFDVIWSYLIVGVIFYGLILSLGAYLAKRGIRNDNNPLALFGTVLLQLGYGTFGASILQSAGASSQIVILGVTALITTSIAILSAIYVYWTDRNLEFTGKYSNYAFLGVLGFAFLGTFIPAVSLFAFILALAGFLLYLVYEIWEMKSNTKDYKLAGIGIYIAYAGVFIHVMQLVARYYIEE